MIAAASALSFTFALAESALFSLSPWQTKRLSEESPHLRPFLQQLLEHPQDLLATIVLGNTAANAVIGGVATLMVLRSAWPAGISFFVIGLLLLIGCEVIPKTIAGRLPERWTLKLLKPTVTFQNVLRPIHLLAQRLNERILAKLPSANLTPKTPATDEDYHELIELGAQSGTLDQEEKEIILEIVSLDSKTVGDVMTPKGQIATIPNGLSSDQMLSAANRFQHRRLVVQDEDLPEAQIIGVVDVLSLMLKPKADIKALMKVPTFIPESMNLWELFIQFQQQKGRLAVVLDEYGETAGIITLEDILDEIMGPIFNPEANARTSIETLGPGRWRVSGTTPIDTFSTQCVPLQSIQEIDTMGGLLATLLAHIPSQPAATEYRGLRFTVEHASARQIQHLIVERLSNKRNST